MITKYFKKKIFISYYRPDTLLYKLSLKINQNINKYLTDAALELCNIQKDDDVLEINFGFGFGLEKVLRIVSEGSGKVYGIEMSDNLIDKGYRNLKQISELKNIKLFKTEVSDLPIRSDSLLVIYHVNCFHYWNDPMKAARSCLEMFRVLKPGGRVIATFNRNIIKSLGSQNLPVLSPLNYMYLLECSGFEDVHMQYHEFQYKKHFESIEARKPRSILLT